MMRLRLTTSPQDLGFANIGINSDEPITPTIDSLARSGAILDSYYTYRFCSPVSDFDAFSSRPASMICSPALD